MAFVAVDTVSDRQHAATVRELLRSAATIAAGVGPRELRVRGGMTGMVQGRHRSRGAGSSTEFYEFRPYTIGDDAGRIDWKVYARSDRLYLRRFAAETRQTVGEVVDCSASMLFRGLGENSKGRSSKLEVASAMATALGLITLRSGDRVAGVMAEAKRLVGRVEVPALSGIGSLSELASGIASGGQIPMQRLRKDEQGDGLGLALEAAGRLSAARGAGGSALVVLFSDALGEPEDTIRALGAARAASGGGQREIALVRVLTPEEIDGPPLSTHRYVDAALRRGRGAGWGRANTKASLDAYRSRMRSHRDALRQGVLALGGRFVEHRTDEDPARALIKLLESG